MGVEDGQVVAAVIFSQNQVPEYANCTWAYDAGPSEVMVMHTLVVNPALKGGGRGTAFVAFYEKYARSNNCPYLRIDTQAKNTAARALYKRLGYSEAGVVPCGFNGIPGTSLVCLEKYLG